MIGEQQKGCVGVVESLPSSWGCNAGEGAAELSVPSRFNFAAGFFANDLKMSDCSFLRVGFLSGPFEETGRLSTVTSVEGLEDVESYFTAAPGRFSVAIELFTGRTVFGSTTAGVVEVVGLYVS